MTDWLSELGWDCESLAHTDEGRMARVIRELVEYHVAYKEYIASLDIGNELLTKDRARMLTQAENNLSPDAKELLE